ncbi:MAG TPA: VOC family protein [Vicinamibacterales bacterium]|nr:VOC family protein [Vicinamibacterales bacterium]
MTRRLVARFPLFVSSLLVSSLFVSPAFAQLVSHPDAPVRVGHYHLNVTSIAEHKKFWADTLGGTMMKFGNIDVVKFPDAFIFLRVRKPTGPTRGTAFDHIGFAVPDVPAMARKLAAAGYKETTGREPKPGTPPPAASGTSAVYGRFAYFIGPDGAKIELVTSADKDAPPIVAHHIHFINKQYVAMQRWYMNAFDATLRAGGTDFFAGADLPGVGYSLNFFRWEGDQTIEHVPTRGRVVDHVGFEVKNLEDFCRKLEAKGIKLTRPYTKKTAAMNGIATAMMVDPWGVSIELTEGLADIK